MLGGRELARNVMMNCVMRARTGNKRYDELKTVMMICVRRAGTWKVHYDDGGTNGRCAIYT